MSAQKKIVLLGSTGSIGRNTLEIVRRHPAAYRVVGLAANTSQEALAEQAREFCPQAVYLKEPAFAALMQRRSPKGIRVFTRAEGLEAFCRWLDADILVAATSGVEALQPVLDYIERGKRVALANKEVLVAAGPIIMRALACHPKASLVPVDSEHSAIFQCLHGQPSRQVREIILTGSGGPLRTIPRKRFGSLDKAFVIKHPKWNMGKKISVDSATMMNKGLEVIEASQLFGLSVDKIRVWIHPEALVHSMVEFRDGSILAQLGVTDMKLPIRYALSYPERLDGGNGDRLTLKDISSLSFFAPDRKKFPCLDLAYEAGRRSGTAPCVLSAADETAVKAYLDDKIAFNDIPRFIEKVMSKHRIRKDPSLQDILNAHDWAVKETESLC